MNATANAATNTTWKPLRDWNQWDPFRIDALGLVTLLGAPEVNHVVGKLVRSRWLEYLPLLGAYVIANDEFTDKQPGFQLYNLDKGIYTPDVAGWFTRWLMAQDIRTAATVVDWTVESKPHSFWVDITIGLIIGILLNGGFLVLTVVMGDWWGLANALSMAISTIARAFLVDCNRSWIDRAAEKAIAREDPPALQPLKPRKPSAPHANKTEEPKVTEFEIIQANIDDLERVKLVLVLSDARCVIVRIPACLTVDCFVFNPKPPTALNVNLRSKTLPPRQKQEDKKPVSDPVVLHWYRLFRGIAWLAFGAHVITIGMSTLVSQIVTVAIIVVPTVLMANGFGCDDMRVGSRLKAKIWDFPHVSEAAQKRMDMYAFLNLTEAQEDSLRNFQLAPHQSVNPQWWVDYDKRKKEYNLDENGQEKPLIDMTTYEDRERALRKRVPPSTPPPGSPPTSKPTSRHTSLTTA